MAITVQRTRTAYPGLCRRAIRTRTRHADCDPALLRRGPAGDHAAGEYLRSVDLRRSPRFAGFLPADAVGARPDAILAGAGVRLFHFRSHRLARPFAHRQQRPGARHQVWRVAGARGRRRLSAGASLCAELRAILLRRAHLLSVCRRRRRDRAARDADRHEAHPRLGSARGIRHRQIRPAPRQFRVRSSHSLRRLQLDGSRPRLVPL